MDLRTIFVSIPCDPFTYEEYVRAWKGVSPTFVDIVPSITESEFDELISKYGYCKIQSIAVDLDDFDEEETLSRFPSGSELMY